MQFLGCQDKELLRKVFLVHGEYDVQKDYQQKLIDSGFSNIEIPAMGEEFEC